jgi:hypothetical protein
MCAVCSVRSVRKTNETILPEHTVDVHSGVMGNAQCIWLKSQEGRVLLARAG